MNPYFRAHQLDSMGQQQNGRPCLPACPPGYAARSVNPCDSPQAAALYRDLRAQAISQYGQLTQEGLWAASPLSMAAQVEIARGDDIMYGLDSGGPVIAPAATATITSSPQKRNIPKRLSLSANVANNFVINDIRAGVEPILGTVGVISAATFIQDATPPPFRSVVVEVGMDFAITVTNVTGADQRFTATVHAKYVPIWAEANGMFARP